MMGALPAPSHRACRTAWRDGEARAGERAVPEETAIALSYAASPMR
jgi:hypothetical protein